MKTKNQQKRGEDDTAPPFMRKSGQRGAKLASKIKPKSLKNRCQLRSKHRCIPRWGFEAILVDFGKENGGMLAPKINEKTISTSKSDFVGFVRVPYARIIFHIILEVEVGRII